MFWIQNATKERKERKPSITGPTPLQVPTRRQIAPQGTFMNDGKNLPAVVIQTKQPYNPPPPKKSGRSIQRIILKVPPRLRNSFVAILAIELMLAIALIIIGLRKLETQSAWYKWTNGIYVAALAIVTVILGQFANRNKADRPSYIAYFLLSLICIGGFGALLYGNFEEMHIDRRLDRSFSQDGKCVEHCRKHMKSSLECECLSNEGAWYSELASIPVLGILIVCFIATSLMALAILFGMCGVENEDTRQRLLDES